MFTNLCAYGCGQNSNHILKNGKYCCSKRPAGCPILKKINSENSKLVYSSGNRISGKEQYKTLSENSKRSMAWSTGKTSMTDSRIICNYDPEKLFLYGSKGPHKSVLIDERGHICESCKLSTWLEKPITLELEHIDGDSVNNTKDNLKLLCPNCHSQTPTWRRRKSKGSNTARTEQEMIAAIISSDNMNQALKKLRLKWGSYETVERCRMRNNLKFGAERGT